MSLSCHVPAEATLIACVMGLAGCTTVTPEARTAALIAQAEAAMGTADLKTLTFTGRGSGASVGQAYMPGAAWPGLQLPALSRSLNFETAAFREEFIRSRSEPLGGGAVPPMGSGDARGVVLARENFAWDVSAVATVAAPATLPARVHDLWTSTPAGAIKAAARLGARAGVRRDFLRRWDTLTFSLPGQFSATLLLEDTGLISRIESTIHHAVLGEMPVITQFLDYRLYASVVQPSRIVQEQDGFPALDLLVTAVAANETVEITVPDNVRAATEVVSIEKVAEGVWFLGGGTHNSVAIELAEQIVLVELPLHEGRARAVLDTANKLVPNKQALTVVNTHHHFDHAGGLRTAAAAGATLVTSALARPYFEAAFARSAAGTTQADAPAGASGGRKASFVAVQTKAVLSDAVRPIEIHELQGSVHARGLLVVWLPREQLLIEADAYTPGPQNAPGTTDAPAPLVADANHLNLVQNLDRLGLAPQRVLPLHGRVVSAADLYAQVGRKPPP
jgi:glyoxylase-like metal-dependent hydrolase (beta-lactamase superfamily II)